MVGYHRQWGFGVGAIQHLLFWKGVDRAQGADTVRFEMHWAVLDLPVHASFALPDFQWLFLRQAVTQTMPRGSPNVSHLLDEVCHGNCPFYRRTARPLSIQQGSVGVRGVGRGGLAMDQMGSSSCIKRETSRSSGATVAKRQSAVQTSVIVQNSLIDNFAEFGASDTASRCSG